MITGASSGIGKATAKAFAKAGYHLVLTARRKDKLNAIAERLQEKYGVSIKTLIFDIQDYKATEKAYKSIPKSWKSKLQILVNNAGGAKGLDPIHEGKLEHWETMINTNIKGLLYLTKLVSQDMVTMKKGHIINICSTAGKEVYPKGNVYCATKHAVDALTKGMRLDLHMHGIKVSQVSPGHVEETEFALNRFDQNAEKAKIYEDFNPLRSSDVAKTIFFIATQPKHVNIQDVVMMGTQQANSTTINRTGRIYDKIKDTSSAELEK